MRVGISGSPFFERRGDEFVPDPCARGPWSDTVLHGRLLGGLAAWTLEELHSDPDFTPARLTVDLLRAARMGPVQVACTLTRSGRRIRNAEAVVFADEAEVARVSAVWLRRGENSTTDAPSLAAWDAPPADPDVATDPDRPFDMQAAPGRGLGARGPRQIWTRESHPLIKGTDSSGFVRLALAGDLASPVVNWGTAGLEHINADFSVYASRLPSGEWIGVESSGRVEHQGVAVSQCVFHDLDGPIGWCMASAIRNPGLVLEG